MWPPGFCFSPVLYTYLSSVIILSMSCSFFSLLFRWHRFQKRHLPEVDSESSLITSVRTSSYFYSLEIVDDWGNWQPAGFFFPPSRCNAAKSPMRIDKWRECLSLEPIPLAQHNYSPDAGQLNQCRGFTRALRGEKSAELAGLKRNTWDITRAMLLKKKIWQK